GQYEAKLDVPPDVCGNGPVIAGPFVLPAAAWQRFTTRLASRTAD
ncbi:MAG: hypothetical protein QOH87_2941, partial [Trebonia sp.]|nr:hypothetical protein [Trebonia sp.]